MNNFLQYSLGKIDIKGIIQIGANTGQECNILKRFTKNIICFEPIPKIFEVLKKNNSDIQCYNFGLGDVNEIKKMYISSNNCESSSFLKPLNHLKYYPITFEEQLDLEIKRFDSLNIELKDFNIIISDTQGYELNVLIGFGELLSEIDLIIVEYINSSLYENDSSLEMISNYLKQFNFELDNKTEEGIGWGNACFIKQIKKNEITII